MSDTKQPVAFIGLGAMGFGMATHLIKQGYPVTGFDVWPPTLEKFTSAGGLTATTPASAVADKPCCVCMVATAQQAQAVLIDGPNAAALALPQGAVLLLCSTVPCDYVQSLAKQLSAIGRPDIHLIDCPVSGGAARAADGTLSIMAGVPSEEALGKSKPLLEELADPAKLYIVQGGIGAGSNMKMVHQVLAAVQILAASEAMGFATHLGLDLAKTNEAVLNSDAWNWMFEHRTPRMLTNYQPVASATVIIVKDTSIITAEARRSGFPTLMTSVAEQVYFSAVGKGYGADDDSGLVRLYAEGKGKVGPVQGAAGSDEERLALVIGLLKGILLCSAAESLAFADKVGLDLDQVFDLCINAAGGSQMLKKYGPSIIRAFREGKATEGWSAAESETSLKEVADGLFAAVEEAQRLKAPVFLGSQALNVIRLALQSSSAGVAAGAVVKVWNSNSMEKAFRPHFFNHGKPDANPAEKRNCHWCQIRSFATHTELPISITNKEDDAFLNPSFRFIDHSVIGKNVPVADQSFRVGCSCASDEECMYSTCECLDEMAPDSDEEADPYTRKKRFAYYSQGAKKGLLRDRVLQSQEPIYECHEGCACSKDCPNRVVERGRTVPLQIFRTKDRGWGVKCPVNIKRGQFVDRYLGEIITSEEADRRRAESTIARRKDVYLFALDKFSDPDSLDPLLAGQPLEVDGEYMSGPTRFINHSCDPNMAIFARVGDHADKHIHDLALFAIKDIPKGTELTFDYVNGLTELESDAHDPSKISEMTKCLCGTAKCRGYLW
ncbi:hypothetical protein QBC32DRAFT_210153 [Pseudoneurospora amorphoporcata]|uniref:Uncharacterized protein n=1 Tax=Pseudoneurospora amorphoporcata TaxID=241081 RepID=A0AAN6SHH7_9PEZI|nr:hypothetical protein QBC32DRAFT_210153 [Pseudoneurospora amorphoporcata]